MESLKLYPKLLIICLLFSFFWPQTSFAQEETIEIEPAYTLRSYTIENGLPDNGINKIYQDRQGFIWVATQDGLVRFDGYDFLTYRREADAEQPGLLGNDIRDIYEDESGTLWVSTWLGGVSRFDGTMQAFVPLVASVGRPGPPSGAPSGDGPPSGEAPPSGDRPADGPPNGNGGPPSSIEGSFQVGRVSITAVFVDSSQTHWLGGPPRTGLIRYNATTESFEQIDAELYAGGSIFDIVGDDEGGIWILTTGGVTRWYEGEFTQHFIDSATGDGTRSAAEVALDRQGGIWLSINNSLHRYDGDQNRFVEIGEVPTGLSRMVFDSGNQLWAGAEDGVYTFSTETNEWTQLIDSARDLDLSRDNGLVRELFIDAEDNIWIGTFNGISILPRRYLRFGNYTTFALAEDGRLSKPVEAIAGIGQTAWLAIDNKLVRFDPVSGSGVSYPLPEFDQPFQISVLEPSLQGGVWIGRAGEVGLLHFDPETEQFRDYMLEEASTPLPPIVGGLSLTEAGDYVWLSLLRNSIRRIHIETGEEFIYAWPGQGGQVVDHNEDPFEVSESRLPSLQAYNGKMWVSRGFETDVYDLETLQLERTLSFEQQVTGVSEIFETSRGEIWISGAQLLTRYQPDTAESSHYTAGNDLSASFVHQLEEDQFGHLWLSSNNGLMRFNDTTETFETYRTNDGVLSSSFRRSASGRDANGRIYFGTPEGLVTFYPDQFVADIPPPKVVLTELRLFNEPVTVGSWSLLNGTPLLSEAIELAESVTFDHTEDLISFAFSSLSFGTPEKNRYRYRLLGLEQNWNEVESERRFASYTHLDGGTYTLEVQGSNADGVWSEETTSLEIVVLPPWWESWWFRVSTVLVLAVLVWGGVRWRLNEVEQHNRELAAEVERQTAVIYEAEEQKRRLAVLEERQQIGRELHDDLGQVIGYVGMQTLAALNRLRQNEFAQTEETLQQLMRVAQDAHTDIRQYILGIRQENSDASESFTDQLKAYVQSLTEFYGLKVTLSLPPNWDEAVLSRDVETQLMRIIQESLNNTRKYAGVDEAAVWFSLTDTLLLVIISDEGAGFDLEARQRGVQEEGDNSPHFGLMIMEERAESFGGDFEIRSTVGEGTQVLVRIPLQAGADPEAAVAGLRVLLVDDHRLYAEGISNLLLTRGVNIIGVAENGLEAQKLAAERQPDLILMDVEMPVCDGLEATRKIKTDYPDIKVVMLTVAADEQKLYTALQYGASGYLLKNVTGREFFQMLADAMSGSNVLPPSLAAKLLNGFIKSAQVAPEVNVKTADSQKEVATPDTSKEQPPATDDDTAKPVLTYRQQQVLELVVQGMSNRQIAEQLFISEHTVKLHVSRILRMFQLKSRYELARHPAANQGGAK